MNDYGNLFCRSENNDIAYTHSGTFHADDVSCAALLKYTFPSIQIKRVLHVPPDAELAFDIGGGGNMTITKNFQKHAKTVSYIHPLGCFGKISDHWLYRNDT